MSDLPRSFDTLGRLSAWFVCAGSTSASCTGGTQAYGFTAQRQGTQVTQSCDTVLNVCNAFGYDEFDRLKSRTVNQGTVQNFTYAYGGIPGAHVAGGVVGFSSGGGFFAEISVAGSELGIGIYADVSTGGCR